jgi:uncharacterized membrane protein YfcA
VTLAGLEWGGGLAMVAAVGLGALSQQVNGFGFAIVCSPVFVLVVGAHDGVRFVNMLGVAISAATLAIVHRRVSWPDVARLGVPALLVLVPMTAVVHRSSPRVLGAVAGSSVLVVSVVLATGVRAPRLRGRTGAIVAGATSGALNLVAGVSGPTVAMYAVNAGWDPAVFRATVQCYFLVLNAASVVALGPVAPPPVLWPALAVALGVGIVAGRYVAGRLSGDTARMSILSLSAIAGAVAVVRAVI